MTSKQEANTTNSWARFVKDYINDVKLHLLQDMNTDSVVNTTTIDDVHLLVFGDPQIKGIWRNTPYRSRLDIFGNDYFLGHIYSTMRKRLNPTHIAVLGDLFSSQWIGDSEFFNRTLRYSKRIFDRDLTPLLNIKSQNHDSNNQYATDWKKWGEDEFMSKLQIDTWQFDYHDIKSWNPDREDFVFINVTGNHDTGYSGDVTYQHLARYNEIFGKDNYYIEYNSNSDNAYRIVVLNNLLLDGPALQPEFLNYTWNFLNKINERNFNGSTILLTHVPFFKDDNLCVDAQEFRFYPDVYEREPYKANLLRSQNHISQQTTNKVFNLIFNNGKPGIVLVGHDHEGCQVIFNKVNDNWIATREPMIEAEFHLQEITVRSMMGEFYGNSGLITGHFDNLAKLWSWNFSLCPFTLQHAWWFAKASALVTGFLWSLYLVL